MKKRLLSVLFAACLVFIFFTGCKDKPNLYTVTVYSSEKAYPNDLRQYMYKKVDGFIILQQLEIESGSVLGNVGKGNYLKDKYRFCGWYTDKDYTEQWNLYKDEVRSDMTLYAKWEKIN